MLRSDIDEPSFTKSSTANDDPKFVTPKTANADPMRAKLLRDRDDPRRV
jgi:hypothetical protein